MTIQKNYNRQSRDGLVATVKAARKADPFFIRFVACIGFGGWLLLQAGSDITVRATATNVTNESIQGGSGSGVGGVGFGGFRLGGSGSRNTATLEGTINNGAVEITGGSDQRQPNHHRLDAQRCLEPRGHAK